MKSWTDKEKWYEWCKWASAKQQNNQHAEKTGSNYLEKPVRSLQATPEARKRLLKQTANCETLENMKTVSCAGRAAEWKWRAHWICADNRFENMCKFCDSIMKFNFSLELSLFTRVFWDISNRIQRDSSDNKTEVVKLKLINWKFRLKMREMKMIRMAMNFSRQFALRSYIADVVGNKPWYTEKGYTWIEKLDWREVYSSREENPCSRRESMQQKRILAAEENPALDRMNVNSSNATLSPCRQLSSPKGRTRFGCRAAVGVRAGSALSLCSARWSKRLGGWSDAVRWATGAFVLLEHTSTELNWVSRCCCGGCDRLQTRCQLRGNRVLRLAVPQLQHEGSKFGYSRIQHIHRCTCIFLEYLLYKINFTEYTCIYTCIINYLRYSEK